MTSQLNALLSRMYAYAAKMNYTLPAITLTMEGNDLTIHTFTEDGEAASLNINSFPSDARKNWRLLHKAIDVLINREETMNTVNDIEMSTDQLSGLQYISTIEDYDHATAYIKEHHPGQQAIDEWYSWYKGEFNHNQNRSKHYREFHAQLCEWGLGYTERQGMSTCYKFYDSGADLMEQEMKEWDNNNPYPEWGYWLKKA